MNFTLEDLQYHFAGGKQLPFTIEEVDYILHLNLPDNRIGVSNVLGPNGIYTLPKGLDYPSTPEEMMAQYNGVGQLKPQEKFKFFFLVVFGVNWKQVSAQSDRMMKLTLAINGLFREYGVEKGTTRAINITSYICNGNSYSLGHGDAAAKMMSAVHHCCARTIVLQDCYERIINHIFRLKNSPKWSGGKENF